MIRRFLSSVAAKQHFQPLQLLQNEKQIRKLENCIYAPLKHLSFVSQPSLSPSSLASEDSKDTIELTHEQQEILNIVTQPHRPCIFFTGQAGTGKTFLLKRIVAELSRIERDQGRDPSETIAVTSTTGISACPLGGSTMHSWTGFGRLSFATSTAMVLRYLWHPQNKHVQQRWKTVNTLIIDECSMLSPHTLDLIDSVGRRLRNNRNVPFGGIQVILSGDFMQLPPVISSNELRAQREQTLDERRKLRNKILKEKSEKAWLDRSVQVQLTKEDSEMIGKMFPIPNTGRTYCFDAKAWKYIIDGGTISANPQILADGDSKVVLNDQPAPTKLKHARELTKPFRQLDDPVFCHFLNVLRKRDFDQKHQLFPVVDAVLNHLWLPYDQRPFDPLFRKLSTGTLKSMEDLGEYVVKTDEGQHVFQFSDLETAEAQNYNRGDPSFEKLLYLAHPSIHPVRLYSHKKDADKYNLKRLMSLNPSTDDVLTIQAVDFKKDFDENLSLMPTTLLLRPGAQVMLLKNIKQSLGLVNGQLGVIEKFIKFPLSALISRARLPKQLNTVTAYMEVDSDEMILPVVKFPLMADWSGLLADFQSDWIQIDREKSTISLPIAPSLESEPDMDSHSKSSKENQKELPERIPTRLQIPLRLGWSYSIHKAQGQTLPKVQVDVGSIFAHGQMYVALSRATSLCSLRVVGYNSFDENVWKLMRHDKVTEFYDHIELERKYS